MKQYSLFEQPTLNVLRDIKTALAEAYRASGLSVDQVCDRVNSLAERHGVCVVKGRGQRLTVDTLQKWLNPEDMTRYPSIKVLPVLCAVLMNTIDPIQAMVAPMGWKVIDEQDAKMLEWAKLHHNAKDISRRMKKLEAEL
ncbi:MAG: hypothetical protein WC952_14395 [Desulfobulbaceae bacterium]